ncbi:hypothetical protein KCM76_22120 [Zooshikella marina]|nr:hypothetical protein [Zooshikella ganghwensis]MBU2708705.1 hypothetical protein [Zooshikella ganghwensis]
MLKVSVIAAIISASISSHVYATPTNIDDVAISVNEVYQEATKQQLASFKALVKIYQTAIKENASENLLKQIEAPLILHILTLNTNGKKALCESDYGEFKKIIGDKRLAGLIENYQLTL